jgi:hypothetical protein
VKPKWEAIRFSRIPERNWRPWRHLIKFHYSLFADDLIQIESASAVEKGNEIAFTDFNESPSPCDAVRKPSHRILQAQFQMLAS